MTSVVIIRSPIEFYEKKKISLLRETLSIPEIQRVACPDRIDEIYNDILSTYNSGKEFMVLGTFIVARVNDVDYLLDGQHRFLAYLRLYEEKKFDTEIVVNTIHTTNENIRTIFNRINDTVPVTSIPSGLNLNSYKTIVAYFTTKFKNNFSKNTNCYRPFVNKGKFESMIISLLQKYPENLQEKLLSFNEELKTLNIEQFKNRNDLIQKVNDNREKAIQNGGLLFGMFLDYKELENRFITFQEKTHSNIQWII